MSALSAVPTAVVLIESPRHVTVKPRLTIRLRRLGIQNGNERHIVMYKETMQLMAFARIKILYTLGTYIRLDKIFCLQLFIRQEGGF